MANKEGRTHVRFLNKREGFLRQLTVELDADRQRAVIELLLAGHLEVYCRRDGVSRLITSAEDADVGLDLAEHLELGGGRQSEEKPGGAFCVGEDLGSDGEQQSGERSGGALCVAAADLEFARGLLMEAGLGDALCACRPTGMGDEEQAAEWEYLRRRKVMYIQWAVIMAAVILFQIVWSFVRGG